MGSYSKPNRTKEVGPARLLLKGLPGVDKHRRGLRVWTRKRPEKYIVGAYLGHFGKTSNQ